MMTIFITNTIRNEVQKRNQPTNNEWLHNDKILKRTLINDDFSSR